jgi:tetratricopeptide (TPR) repeat protein
MEPALLLTGRLVYLTLFAILAAELLSRLGAAPARFCSLGRGTRLEEFGVGYLTGISTVGTAFLGLACAGLFTKTVVLALFLGLILASRRSWKAASIVFAAFREYRAVGAIWILLLAALALPTAVAMLAPETEQDAFIYHLGSVWQLLQTGRLSVDYAPLSFHLPLPVEMNYAIPLALGDDRMAKWMLAICFAAATAIFGSRMISIRNPSAAWLGPVIAMGTSDFWHLLSTTKNDVAAAALFVSGALLLRYGRPGIGALLLGTCCAAKLVFGPFVAIWCLLNATRIRRPFFFGLLLFIPVLPWLAKLYLETGNPLFPFATGILPAVNWDGRNWTVFQAYADTFRSVHSWNPLEFGKAFLQYYLRENAALLAALPLLLVYGRDKIGTTAAAASQLLMLAIGPHVRYLLPVTWLIGNRLAEETGRIRDARRKTALIIALTGFLAWNIGRSTTFRMRSWEDSWHPLPAVLGQRLTTYGEMASEISVMKLSRILLVGEMKTYLIPARVIYGGALGETPVPWRITRESRDSREMRKRFRQIGAGILVHNYVTGFNIAKYYAAFPWDAGMLGKYFDFCRTYMNTISEPAMSDNFNGGFAVISLASRPLSPPRETVFFLPGTEDIYMKAIACEKAGDIGAEIGELKALSRMLPGVRFTKSEIARLCLMKNDPKGAYRELKPSIDQGALEESVLVCFGTAAYQLQRLDEAERAFRRHLALYRYNTNTVRYRLAHVLYLKTARRAGKASSAGDAELLRQADNLLDFTPEPSDKIPETVLRQARACVNGRLADYLASRGDFGGALYRYDQAIRLAPELTNAVTWKRNAARLHR